MNSKTAKHKNTQKLSITLIKSRAGRLPKHKATLVGLGLKRIGQTVMLEDTPCIRGMINQVSYLLAVEQSKS